jgi:ribosomal protein S12 methylthiotransferase
MKPGFWIDPHGCAKNDVDAENLVAVLTRSGFRHCARADDADVIIVNSCGFIESAKRESIEALISLKESYPGKKIGLFGCLAQRYPEELSESLVEADGIFGNGDLGAAATFLERLIEGERPVTVPERVPQLSGAERTFFLSSAGVAYLKPTEGCSNHCSYCAIPLIRGELSSRPEKDILSEAAALESRGVREINLVGQDLGSYGKDLYGTPRLPELLAGLLGATREAVFRVLYVHPDHFPSGILPLMASQPRILPYLDLPFQHASAAVLKAMNRSGSAPAYLELIASIRMALPDAVIRTSFLIGFPGETEADIDILLDFIERAEIDWAGFFAYSREDGTRAAALKGRIGKKTIQARIERAQAVQEAVSARRLDRYVGRELEVLIEERIAGAGEPDGPLSLGRAYLQAPDVDGLTVVSGLELSPGDIAACKVHSRAGMDLSAVALRILRPFKRGAGA